MKQQNKIEWREIELSKLGELIMGQSPKGESYNESKKGVPLLNGAADFKNNKILPKQYTTKPTKLSKKEDILFCIRATIGKAITSDGEYCLGRGVAGFRTNNTILSNKFFLRIIDAKLNSLILQGSTIVGVRGEDIKKLRIPIPFSKGSPDIKEQERIVSILEKAEKLKQKGKGAGDLLNEYLKSVFNEMFFKRRFEERPLGKITHFIDYRGKTPKKTEKGVPLITAKNVREGYISQEPREFIAEEDYLSWMRRGFPQEGDILFTTEAPLGNVARLGKFNKIALAQRIIAFQCSKELNSYYLLYALLSDTIKKNIIAQSTGSTVSGIRSRELRMIKIPLPPLPLQQKFAKIVEQVEKMKENVKKTKKNSEELFDSLMQKAFRGEL